jgi:hypothetical protein
MKPKSKIGQFTYIGRENRYITKLLKKHIPEVAYTTNNNLGNAANPKTK